MRAAMAAGKGGVRAQARRLSRLRPGIGGRLAVGLALLSLLLGAVIATAFDGLEDTGARVNDLATAHLPKVIEANLLIDRANETARMVAEMALLPEAGPLARRRAQLLAIRQDAAERLARLRSRPLAAEERRLLDRVTTTRRDYLDVQDRFLALLATGDREAARLAYAGDVRPRQDAYVAAIGALTRYQGDTAALENARAQRHVRQARTWLASIAALAVALGALFGWRLVRSITRPLAEAGEIARRVAAGQPEPPVPGRFPHDEIGELLQALRAMACSLASERAALIESRELLAQSQAQALLGSWWYDPATQRLVLSEEARRLFGAQPGDAVDEAWLTARVHPDDRALVGHCRKCAADGQPRDSEFRLVVDGRERWVRTRSELRPGEGQPRRVLCTLQDISLLRHRQAELLESREQLRALAAHHEREREELRAALSRELHDQIGQYLTVLRLDAAMMRRRFSHLDPEIEPLVATMKGSIDQAMVLLRDVVAALRPAPLDEGLVPAAEWLLAGFARRTGIDCRLEAPDPDPVLDGALATAAFRILQEALTNVGRHAQASRVRVGIAMREGALHLEVADDGVGFDPAASHRGRFGLLGMRERALMFGGTLQVDSRPGGGTILRVVLPVAEVATA